MIAAGRLNKRIQIQVRVPIKDEFGHTDKSPWSTIATVWAVVEPISGRQLIASEQVLAEITHKIVMRYRPGITPDHRIAMGSRTFKIEYPINVREKNVLLELLCSEVVGHG